MDQVDCVSDGHERGHNDCVGAGVIFLPCVSLRMFIFDPLVSSPITVVNTCELYGILAFGLLQEGE